MRRPRGVGIIIVMLLGLSGCAGMQQQEGWTSPVMTSAHGPGADERPLARLAFWRRPRADSNTVPADRSGTSDPGQTGLAANDPASSSDASSKRPSLLRRFTLLGQRLKGSKDDDSELATPPAWKLGSPAAGPVSTAYTTTASSRVASGSNAAMPSARPVSVASHASTNKPQLDVEAIPAAHSGTSSSSADNSESAPPVPFAPDAD